MTSMVTYAFGKLLAVITRVTIWFGIPVLLINSVAYGQQCAYSFVRSIDGVHDGTSLSFLRDSQGIVMSVNFLTASRSRSPSLEIWGVDGKKRRGIGPILNTDQLGNHRSFAVNSDRIAIGEALGNITIWSLMTGQLERTITPRSWAQSLAFTKSGTRLVSGTLQVPIAVEVWDAATGARLSSFDPEAYYVLAVAVSPANDNLIAIGVAPFLGGEINFIVWDMQTSRRVNRRFGRSGAWIQSVAFAPKGDLAAVASQDGQLYLLDTTKWQSTRQFRGHMGGATSVAFHPEQGLLASGGRDDFVRIWNVNDSTEVCALRVPTQCTTCSVESVTFSPDGQWLAAVHGSGKVDLWRKLASGRSPQ